jgi:hypothetical protein
MVNTAMKKLRELENSIWSELSETVYYDTNVDFDEGSGILYQYFIPMPDDPMLNNVLKWHSLKGRNKYSHFEVSGGNGRFEIYDSEEGYSLDWDLSKNLLKHQSDELIEFLHELI